MNCPQCGGINPDGSSNCKRCGAKLESSGPAQAPAVSMKIQILMIWVPMFISLIVYIVMGQVFIKGPKEPSVPAMMSMILLAMAAGSVFIGVMLVKINLAEDKVKQLGKKQASETVQTRGITSMSLIESGGVFGLMMKIFGFPVYYLYGAVALAAIGLIAILPMLLAAINVVENMPPE